MKGIILAGGTGSRLYPLTLAANKHLLPVYDKPVIYYAVQKLVDSGIDKIMLITSPEHIESFVRLLGSGQRFVPKNTTAKQIQIIYGIQNEPNGIAYGLYIAKEFVGNDNCVLYLGDNIFEDDLTSTIQSFSGGATVFLKKVKDPERFGVAEVDKKGRVKSIVEKPKKPKSDLAVTGVYLYDSSVFKKMIGQPKSDRGELEITYINNLYAEQSLLKSHELKKEWFDIGTIESLHHASVFMKNKIT
jgi:glucose-1-phosphate thymidylyltransferase